MKVIGDTYAKRAEMINSLKTIFICEDDYLSYSNETQDRISELLEQIAEFSGTFNKNISNEKENIKNDLTIYDSLLQRDITLIDIDSLDERVKSVLEDNNIYSCLKTLALSNKCAHGFDGDIESVRDVIEEYYHLLTSKHMPNVTFMKPFESVFPDVSKNDIYSLKKLTDNSIKKIKDNIINNKTNVRKAEMISTLKALNIPFNIRDDAKIKEAYLKVINEKEKFYRSVMIEKYRQGRNAVRLQNKMFAIKDCLIVMIAQILNNYRFKNVFHELVQTSGSGIVSGFEYMLIIDDKELSYYIEVHMPDVIKEELIKNYGYQVTTRTTKNLGASAVYKRDKQEVKEIHDAIESGAILESNVRASIITRDYDADKRPRKESYEFLTKPLTPISYDLADFIKAKIGNPITLDEISDSLLNENYPEEVLRNEAYDNYLEIYDLFSYDQKFAYIDYVLTNNPLLYESVINDFGNPYSLTSEELEAIKKQAKEGYIQEMLDTIDEWIHSASNRPGKTDNGSFLSNITQNEIKLSLENFYGSFVHRYYNLKNDEDSYDGIIIDKDNEKGGKRK